MDGDTGRAQGVDVAVNGPPRNLQTCGELACGQAPTGLQKKEQSDYAICANGLLMMTADVNNWIAYSVA